MKVKIDYGICMGERNCVKTCPEVFEFGEHRVVGVVLAEEVPKHLEAKVRQAAEACNVKAVVVEE